jgi:hypothetical protein
VRFDTSDDEAALVDVACEKNRGPILSVLLEHEVADVVVVDTVGVTRGVVLAQGCHASLETGGAVGIAQVFDEFQRSFVHSNRQILIGA